MASTSAVAMTLPVASARKPVSHDAFFNPMKMPLKAAKPSLKAANGRMEISASLKEKAVTGLTAVALTAAMVLPDVAEAAQPGVSPSLKNFLLSILSGGVVLGVIVGAVIGVANFDPVKRS
ncbi:hypothetical protein H6P81_001878 [Aristolochia fimbriata]|uniref:Ultraviolet-B-repressible protein n=1 Tax=Aristolochia fimbriata TaxID=158543 RepID=A0AAV7F859_ARIFI|nr:hypothetical protein H6P81_001878 [Aristolochia fimbriata]